MTEKIILIGPMGVGKSSVAHSLAARFDSPVIDIDELRWGSFARMPGYDDNIVKKLFDSDRGAEAFAYMKPFEAQLVVQVLEEYGQGIFDFGAGYTVYEDRALFEQVRRAFAPYRHIFLLRYSADPEESLNALKERHDIPEALYYALNRPFIESPCNAALARHIIDTKAKTIAQIAAEIGDLISP